jgi:anti-sigma B factor antagonist
MTAYPREPIVVRIERDDKVTTLVLSGELDLSTIVELQHALEAECSSSPSRLVIDIAAVEFIDSATLHLFITMSNRLADGGGSLEIVHVPERLRRIFSITNLDALLLAEPLVDGPGRRAYRPVGALSTMGRFPPPTGG